MEQAQTSHAIDIHTPSVARMYDWYLGGRDNYATDRAACRRLLEIAPSTQRLARTNRRFLHRVVRVLAEKYGVRRFLDHGSGLPTQENVHQVAQRVDPSARVVYLDNDPIVLAHGRMLLEENENTAFVEADFTNTDEVFSQPEVTSLVATDEPVAALFVSVLHCIPDTGEPAVLVRNVAERLPPGSYIVICHLVSSDQQVRDRTTRFMREQTHGRWGRVREEREVAAYFEGTDILDPGLVEVSAWRPDPALPPDPVAEDWIEWGGVGRTPQR